MTRLAGIVCCAGGMVVLIGSGFWSFILDLRILYEAGGPWAALLGGIFFPFMITVAPFYAGAIGGFWYPLRVTLFGVAYGAAMLAVGSWILTKDKARRELINKGERQRTRTSKVIRGFGWAWLSLVGLVSILALGFTYAKSPSLSVFWESTLAPWGGVGALKNLSQLALLSSPCVPLFALANRIEQRRSTAWRSAVLVLSAATLAFVVVYLMTVLVQAVLASRL